MALELLKNDGSLATMTNEEGTALHVVARQEISHFSSNKKVLDSRHVKKAAMRGVPSKRLSLVLVVRSML